jgi:hypothetical protein
VAADPKEAPNVSLFFDRDGCPIDQPTYLSLFEDDTYREVERTEMDGLVVSTIWWGINATGGDPPLIYETAVLGDNDCEVWRWPTVGSAREGHRTIVEALRKGNGL